MQQLIFVLGLFASTLILPSAPTPHVSQAVGLDADQKSAFAGTRSPSDSRAVDRDPADLKTSAAYGDVETDRKKLIANLADFHSYPVCYPQPIIEKIKKLIALGFDINQPIPVPNPYKVFQITLLHRAACSSPEITRFLIAAGANIDVVDPLNKTPAHWAIFSNTDDALIVLIASGANMDIPGHYRLSNNPETGLEYILNNPKKPRKPAAVSALVEISERSMTDYITGEKYLASLPDHKPDPLIQPILIGLRNRELRKQHEAFIANLTKNNSDQSQTPFSAALLPPLWKLIFTLAGRPIIYSFQELDVPIVAQS